MNLLMLNFQEFARQQINEIGDQPYTIRFKKSPRKYQFFSEISDERLLEILFYSFESGSWSILFTVDGSSEITGEGDAYKIFATVVAAIEQFVKVCDQPISRLVLVAFHQYEGSSKQKTSRADLYRAMLKKYARRGKFEFSERRDDERSVFTLYKKESSNA